MGRIGAWREQAVKINRNGRETPVGYAATGLPRPCAQTRPEISLDYVRFSHSPSIFWRNTLVLESGDASVAGRTKVEVMDTIHVRTA